MSAGVAAVGVFVAGALPPSGIARPVSLTWNWTPTVPGWTTPPLALNDAIQSPADGKATSMTYTPRSSGIAQMNVAGFGGMGDGGLPATAEAPGSGDPAGAGLNPTWTVRSGAAIVFFPEASRIPNRKRFCPTIASDEMTWGMNGALPPTVLGEAAVARGRRGPAARRRARARDEGDRAERSEELEPGVGGARRHPTRDRSTPPFRAGPGATLAARMRR